MSLLRSYGRHMAVAAVFALVATSLVHADDPKTKPSKIFGTVTLSSGNPAPAGVQLRLKQKNTYERQKPGSGGNRGRGRGRSAEGVPTPIPLANFAVVTDANGQYVFNAVTPGDYEFEVGKIETIGYYASDLKVDGEGAPIQLDVKLDPPDRGE